MSRSTIFCQKNGSMNELILNSFFECSQNLSFEDGHQFGRRYQTRFIGLFHEVCQIQIALERRIHTWLASHHILRDFWSHNLHKLVFLIFPFAAMLDSVNGWNLVAHHTCHLWPFGGSDPEIELYSLLAHCN